MSILLAGHEVCLFSASIFRLFIDRFPIPHLHTVFVEGMSILVGISLYCTSVQKVLGHLHTLKALYEVLEKFFLSFSVDEITSFHSTLYMF